MSPETVVAGAGGEALAVFTAALPILIIAYATYELAVKPLVRKSNQ